ncbi:MAG: hypothetical protein OIF50_14645, partial [Flavobacteriaceae bacterium]|nr:hypothetical protein [Flavobacteriaceae bacterium]
MKEILLYTVISLLCCSSFAQMNENTKLPSVLPPSPKMFEFMKYGEIPVGKYTGVANISIPIYNIEAGGLNIPLSLTYHSNGFRVNEEAGWTGLGWTLQGGGNIVQIINGTDDFGYYSSRLMPDFQNIASFLPQSVMGTCSNFYISARIAGGTGFGGCSFYNGSVVNAIHPSFVKGIWDSEPDIFKFNVLGYSGSFILDWENETFVCLTDKTIKIFPNNHSSNKEPGHFWITVPDGHKFLFTLKEESIFVADGSQSTLGGGGLNLSVLQERASRTYQLETILTNKGDVIKYNYNLTDEIIGYPSISESISIFEKKYPFEPPPINFLDYDIIKNTSLLKQRYSYLSSIEFPEGEILFTTSDRIDLIGSKKLDRIEIKSVNTSSIIKSFNFNYDYFIGHKLGSDFDADLNNYNNYVTKTATEKTYRLKLTSLEEIGKPQYLFEYNEKNLLPKKTSLASDYWGYYNGYLSNNRTFPNLYRFNFADENNYLDDYKDNNKGASLEHSKSAVLKKITYPTGGYTEFSYELNSFDNYLAPSIDYSIAPRSINIDTNPNTKDFRASTIITLQQNNVRFSGRALLSVRGCRSQELNTAYADTYIKIYSFKESLLALVENGQYYSANHALGALGLVEGTSNFNQTNFNLYIDKQEIIKMQQNSVEEQFFSGLNYTFNKGILYARAFGGCGTYNGITNSSQASLTLSYFSSTPHTPISFGGGLRIKEISNYNSNSKLVTKKKYDYEGGKLMTPLLYVRKSDYGINHKINYPGSQSEHNCKRYFYHANKLTISSSSVVNMSTSANGKYVGYDKVTEKKMQSDQNDSNIGKTITSYINNPDQSGVNSSNSLIYSSNAVALPPVEHYLENGLVSSELIYDKNNKLVRKQSYNYNSPSLINNNCFYGARYSRVFYATTGLFNPCDDGLCEVYQIGAYSIKKKYKSLLSSSKMINYSEGDSITNSKEYLYNNYHQVSNIKEINSRGQIKEINLKYSHDFSDFPYNYMISDNFISPIIEKEVKLNSEFINKEKFSYSRKQLLFDDLKVLTYPISKYLQGKNSNSLEDSVIYHSYDNSGNPVEISKADGTHIYYVWGYNKTQPIAKLENFTSSDATKIKNIIQAAVLASNQ